MASNPVVINDIPLAELFYPGNYYPPRSNWPVVEMLRRATLVSGQDSFVVKSGLNTDFVSGESFFQSKPSNADNIRFARRISDQEMQEAALRATRLAQWHASIAGAISWKDRNDDSIISVLRRLDEVVNDADQYEVDEQPPTPETIWAVRSLLLSMARMGYYQNLPKTYISVYYGEIAITWKTARNLVRVTFRPDNHIELYRQEDYRDSARGESIRITVDDTQQVDAYIRWLSEDTRAATPERSHSNR